MSWDPLETQSLFIAILPPTNKTKQVLAIISSGRYTSLWNMQRTWGSYEKLIQPLLLCTCTGGIGTFQEFWNFLLFLFRSTWQHILHQLQQNSCDQWRTLWFAFYSFLLGSIIFQGQVLFLVKVHTAYYQIVQEAHESTRLLDRIWLSASASSTNLTFFKSLPTISEHLKYLAIVVLLSRDYKTKL